MLCSSAQIIVFVVVDDEEERSVNETLTEIMIAENL